MGDLSAALTYLIPQILRNLGAGFRQRTDQPHRHKIEEQQIQRAVAFEEIVDLRRGGLAGKEIEQRMMRRRVLLA